MIKSHSLNESTYQSRTSLLLCSCASKLEASQSEIFDRVVVIVPSLSPTSLLASFNIIKLRGAF